MLLRGGSLSTRVRNSYTTQPAHHSVLQQKVQTLDADQLQKRVRVGTIITFPDAINKIKWYIIANEPPVRQQRRDLKYTNFHHYDVEKKSLEEVIAGAGGVIGQLSEADTLELFKKRMPVDDAAATLESFDIPWSKFEAALMMPGPFEANNIWSRQEYARAGQRFLNMNPQYEPQADTRTPKSLTTSSFGGEAATDFTHGTHTAILPQSSICFSATLAASDTLGNNLSDKRRRRGTQRGGQPRAGLTREMKPASQKMILGSNREDQTREASHRRRDSMTASFDDKSIAQSMQHETNNLQRKNDVRAQNPHKFDNNSRRLPSKGHSKSKKNPSALQMTGSILLPKKLTRKMKR